MLASKAQDLATVLQVTVSGNRINQEDA